MATSCPFCGSSFISDMSKCPHCGASIEKNPQILNPINNNPQTSFAGGCAFHPGRPAQGSCTHCGRMMCSDCTHEYQNKLVCKKCFDSLLLGSKGIGQTSTNVISNLKVGSVGSRLIAFIIDLILVSITAGLYAIYWALVDQTLGKKLMKLKVVMEDGSKPSIGINIGRFIILIFLDIYVGWILVLNAEQKRIADYIFKTRVIQE